MSEERRHAKHAMRETSLLSYLESAPKLGEMQDRVYKCILQASKGGEFPTDREIATRLGCDDPNAVRPRRFELMKLGLVKEAGKRNCMITGRTALTWRAVKA